MSLNASELASKMFEAFSGKLSEKWPDVKDYAEAESKKLAVWHVPQSVVRRVGALAHHWVELQLVG